MRRLQRPYWKEPGGKEELETHRLEERERSRSGCSKVGKGGDGGREETGMEEGDGGRSKKEERIG